MVKEFCFNLSLPAGHKTFVVGETISGTLHFTLTESKSYKTIYVLLYGRASVWWTETYTTGGGDSMGGSQTHTVTYSAKEEYVSTYVLLWSSEQHGDGKIGPGMFDMPFQVEIPHNCLGSFEGKHGNIRYYLQGHIKTEHDHKISIPLTVNRQMDINIPILLEPAYKSQQKQVAFCCFGTSNIEFTASLSHTGFCIGHNLPLTVNVVNGSGRRIKIRASVQRICTFHAQGHNVVNGSGRQIKMRASIWKLCTFHTHAQTRHTKHTREKLVVILSPPISPHSQYTWQEGSLVVPMVEPSFLESQIIKMQYCLKVTALIPWASNSSVMIPITLGNVPLNQ